MLPCEIEPEIEEQLICCEIQKTWNKIQKLISVIRLYLKQYSLVIQVQPDEKTTAAMDAYIESLIKQVDSLWSERSQCKDLLYQLEEEANEFNAQLLNAIRLLFEQRDSITTCINERTDPSTILSELENLFGAMILLNPYVAEYSCRHS